MDSFSSEQKVNTSAIILTNIIKISWALLFIFYIIQNLFFGSLNNLLCTTNILLVWFFAVKYLLNPISIAKYPISIFLILSFTTTQFYFPLAFTTIEFKSLIFNLNYPIEVFIHSDLALLVLIVSHLVYRGSISSFIPKVQSKISFFNFHAVPTKSVIWIMGYLGLVATFLAKFEENDAGIWQKIFQGSTSIAYIPYLLPCTSIFGSKEKFNNSDLMKLIGFSVLIIIINIGLNTRGGIIWGVVSIGLVYGLGYILGMYKTRMFTTKNVVIIGLGIYLFVQPLSDLGVAMLMVRAQRTEISKEELISKTIDAFLDKDALEKYHNYMTKTRMAKGDWDENYLDNIYLARFCNLKFNDLSLEESYLINANNDTFYNFTIDRVYSSLPEPILNLFQINIDKKYLVKGSFGDFLYKQGNGGGDEIGIGYFRTGHFAGTGMAAFGWSYLLILGITIIPIYLLFDIFSINRTIIINNQVHKYNYLSICILVNILIVFQFLPSESVIGNITFLIRGWIQMLFIYSIFYFIANKISKIL